MHLQLDFGQFEQIRGGAGFYVPPGRVYVQKLYLREI